MYRLGVTFAAVGALWSAEAFAQQQGDGGALINELNKQSGVTGQQVQAPTPQDFVDVGDLGTIQGLSAEEETVLRDAIRPFKGKRVSLSWLERYAAQRLAQQGYSVALQINPDFTVLAVHPTLGRVRVENGSKLASSLAEQMVNRGVEIGKPLDRNILERNATVLNEIPGIATAYQMVPGTNPGETDLVVRVADRNRVEGQVSIANAGLSSVGVYQLSGGLAFNNLMGSGERFQLTGLVAAHSWYAGASADAPLTASGLRLGAFASIFSFSYTAELQPGARLAYDGTAVSGGANLVLPLLRDQSNRVNLTSSYEFLRVRNNSAGAENSVWRIQKGVIGVNGLHIASSGASLSYLLNATIGDAKQGNAIARRSDPFLDQIGSFGKFNANLTMTQPLFARDNGLFFQTTLAGQLSSRNLADPEKFYIGGANMLRAYSPQLIGGDDVIYSEIRLGKRLAQNVVVGAFFEAARVKAFKDGITGSTLFKSNYAGVNRLSDAGLALNWDMKPGLRLDTSVAVKTGGSARLLNGTAIRSTNDQKGDVGVFARLTARF